MKGCNNNISTGRNGGHLTPATFGNFKATQAAYGTDEAIRGFQLERYTATEILRIIKQENLETEVDLVAGGHITLLLSKRDFENNREDYDAAIAAGMDLDEVEWLDKEYMNEVLKCWDFYKWSTY